MKVDNTYDYKLPPYYMEAFLQYMLESDEGMRKLIDLHEKYPLKTKKAYNVVDYINSMDYVVRLMEIGLGMQYGGFNNSLNVDAVNQARKGKESEDDLSPLDNRLNVTQDNRDPNINNSIEFEDAEIDSEDVFANNPSNLMLAKVKVKRKSISNTPKPTDKC